MTVTLRRLLALAAVPRGRLAVSVLLGALTIVCGVGLMATAGYLISRAAERPEVLALSGAIVGVRFFGLLRPLSRYLERLSSHDLAFRVLGRVRVRVYERLEPLAPVQLDGFRRGDLLSRMVADVDALQNLYLRGVGPPLVALLAGAVSVGVTAAFLPLAAILLAAGLLVGGIVVPALSVSLGRWSETREAEARGLLTADLVELVRGAPELVVYGRHDDRLELLRERDGMLVSLARRAALADGLGDALRLVVTGATTAAVLAAAIAAHDDGRLDRVLIAMLGLLALASFEAVQPLPQSARELAETVAAGGRVLELTDQEPDVVDPPAPAELPGGPVAVAFEDVSARYSPAEPAVLNGFDLRLEPGQRIALVGPSGAGKSTAVNLLLRFLDPEHGRVTLGGRDLREYRAEDVRRAVAVAGQDSHLFSTTIRENVRLARPDASDQALEVALRRARIWERVQAFPDGWDTLVGEEGRELSGGERQRIVLARALLAGAPVLVLDEPTAHLDPPTAEHLIEDVVDAVGDGSLLLITHRPEGLQLMDEVVAIG